MPSGNPTGIGWKMLATERSQVQNQAQARRWNCGQPKRGEPDLDAAGDRGKGEGEPDGRDAIEMRASARQRLSGQPTSRHANSDTALAAERLGCQLGRHFQNHASGSPLATDLEQAANRPQLSAAGWACPGRRRQMWDEGDRSEARMPLPARVERAAETRPKDPPRISRAEVR